MRAMLKWIPILAMPFSVLFFDTYINVKVRINDYRMFSINKQRRALEQESCTLEAERAWHGSMSLIGERAPNLGLVEPNPSQIQVVHYKPERNAASESHSYDIARATREPVTADDPVAYR